MNWEKLDLNLTLTIENKMVNLHKLKLFSFQTYWMRYFISSNFENLSMNWENTFSIGKIGILNPLWIMCHTAELLVLVKVLNKSMDYLLYYPSRQQVKWKHFKCKFTFHNGFMKSKELNLFGGGWLYLNEF